MGLTRLTKQQLIDDRLTSRLGYIQRVQAFNHIGKHISGTVVEFPYDKWKSLPAPLYRLNGDIVTPTSTDLTLGTATLTSLTAGDDLIADYTFSYFSNEDLDNFYDLAIARYNNAQPATLFSFDTYPIDAEEFLTKYAYKLSLETMLVDLMGWRARLIWSDPNQLATIVQGVLSSIDAEITAQWANLKGRRFITPKSISVGRFNTPNLLSDSNWQRFTTIRTS